LTVKVKENTQQVDKVKNRTVILYLWFRASSVYFIK